MVRLTNIILLLTQYNNNSYIFPPFLYYCIYYYFNSPRFHCFCFFRFHLPLPCWPILLDLLAFLPGPLSTEPRVEEPRQLLKGLAMSQKTFLSFQKATRSPSLLSCTQSFCFFLFSVYSFISYFTSFVFARRAVFARKWSRNIRANENDAFLSLKGKKQKEQKPRRLSYHLLPP